MSLLGEQVLLRVYLQTADRAPHTPTHQRLIKAARQMGIAGATELKGIMGIGSQGLIHSSVWSLAEHVPVIVEIVDTGSRIDQFLAVLDEHLVSGMATLERANVMMYRHRKSDPASLQLAPPQKPLSTLPPLQPRTRMQINQDGILLRVFIGESDKLAGKPLHQAILEKVRELGLAGATVLRGSEGFGANSVVHRAGLLEMSTDLPIVIEIVDSQEKINLIVPHLEQMVQEGMITMEYVMILLYRHHDKTQKVQG